MTARDELIQKLADSLNEFVNPEIYSERTYDRDRRERAIHALALAKVAGWREPS